MCGRFVLKDNARTLAEHFHATAEFELSPSWNIIPSSRICVITVDADGRRHLRQMRWGLIPSWAKDEAIGNRLANARGETLSERPSFRSAFKYRRCLIPASGFYEWKTEGRAKFPWYISYKSGEPMALAGLWESWHPKDREPLESCCIITTDANELMRSVRDRMPVILDAQQWEAWLSLNEKQGDKLSPMLRSHDPRPMQAWPVTRELNRVGFRDDGELIKRIDHSSGL